MIEKHLFIYPFIPQILSTVSQVLCQGWGYETQKPQRADVLVGETNNTK